MSACSAPSTWLTQASRFLSAMEPHCRAVVQESAHRRPNDIMLDVKIDPLNDSGGGGPCRQPPTTCVSVNDAERRHGSDGRRYLSPTTVKLMTSDHLAIAPRHRSRQRSPDGRGWHTFGHRFMVRQGRG